MNVSESKTLLDPYVSKDTSACIGDDHDPPLTVLACFKPWLAFKFWVFSLKKV